MDNKLKDLMINNKIILVETERTVQAFRVQNYDKALRKSARLLDHLNILFELLPAVQEHLDQNNIWFDQELLLNILQELLQAQSRKDYVLLADLYEVQMLPVLYQFQQALLSYEEFSYDHDNLIKNIELIEQRDGTLANLLSSIERKGPIAGYSVEPASTGDLTVGIGEGDKKCYLHSNINVWKEGAALAGDWYQKDKNTMIIYGLGLGYHIVELILLDATLNVEVYESDLNMLYLACSCTDNIRHILKPQIKLMYDPDFSRLSDRITRMGEDEEFVIHYPSLQVLPQGPVKDKLENYFIQYSSVKSQLPLLKGNFNRNIRHYDGLLEELKEVFRNKVLFIVAAGPSLDKNFLQLKELGGRGIILAAGTVFQKLLKEGIRPDYVLVTDPNPRVYKQISGYEDCDVPMLYLSTAYYGFAENYKGKKYMLCQKDYPKAEEFAESHQQELIQTGGSVSTTALDIGISLGCSRIIFLGLDLAYTDNFAHASDTSRRKAVQQQDMRQVEDIHGNMVTTSRSLDIFRSWIENRIKDVKEIEFIDATEGGARVHGMRIAKLEEVLMEL